MPKLPVSVNGSAGFASGGGAAVCASAGSASAQSVAKAGMRVAQSNLTSVSPGGRTMRPAYALHAPCRNAKSPADERLGSTCRFRIPRDARAPAPTPGNATPRCTAPGRPMTRRGSMLNSKTLDELAARIGKAFEASPAKDIEKNVKAMLQSGLTRLDLVTRQDLEVQAEVLRKTREKVELLEARVAELEARAVPPAPPAQPLS